MSERPEDAEDRMKLTGPPEDWWKREEMSKQEIEEAIFCLQGLRRFYGEPEAGYIQLLLDYIAQLEAENTCLSMDRAAALETIKKYKVDSNRLDWLGANCTYSEVNDHGVRTSMGIEYQYDHFDQTLREAIDEDIAQEL